jgi:hypothetical protein
MGIDGAEPLIVRSLATPLGGTKINERAAVARRDADEPHTLDMTHCPNGGIGIVRIAFRHGRCRSRRKHLGGRNPCFGFLRHIPLRFLPDRQACGDGLGEQDGRGNKDFNCGRRIPLNRLSKIAFDDETRIKRERST